MLRLLLPLLALICLLPAAQATEFKIATLAPDGSSWMNAMKQGASEIEQRTGGRVTFRFYPGGIMGNDRSVLRRIRVGQLHGGAITGGGLSEILPESQIYSLPFLFEDYAEVDSVRKKIDPQLISAMYDKGFVSFGISEGGFAYLLSNSAISGVTDLAGHKVWIPEGDDISRAAFQASGVSPIPLPLTDVLTGLQTGLIDTVAGSPTGVIALQWHTRVSHLTEAPLMYLYGSLVIQRRAFERLKQADQQIVHEVMGNTFRTLDRSMRDDNHRAMEALRTQGIQFVPLQQAEMVIWRSKVDQAMDKLLDNGLFDAALLQQLRRHQQAHRSQSASN